MDLPIFLDKHCGLAAIQNLTDTTAPPQSACPMTIGSLFPFDQQHSSLTCLKSALAIARAFEDIASPSSSHNHFHPSQETLEPPSDMSQAPSILPFFSCAAMQSSYVLFMSHYRLRAALLSDQVSNHYYLLHHPEPGSEIQDAERLLRELRRGIESILGSMKLTVTFEGVAGMGHEIHAAYQSAFGVRCSEFAAS